MNSDLTSKLTTEHPSVSENIFKLLKMGQYGITVGPTEMLNQDNLLGVQEREGSHTQFKPHTGDSSLDFEINLHSRPESTHSSDLKNNPPPYVDVMSDFSEVTAGVAFSTVSASQLLPRQTSFPTSVLMPARTYYTDYLTLTSDLKEDVRISSEWSRWDLQPSVHGQESPPAGQRLSVTTSLPLSSLELIPASTQLISGEFLFQFGKLLEKSFSSTEKKVPVMVTRCSKQPLCNQGSSPFNGDATCCCT
ncbi:hypothetical protein CB1_001873001 [Camelus ferus]|nr:hypothetical protein CB1_001873001 [Camelus ferus]